jgi:hypothetical protein
MICDTCKTDSLQIVYCDCFDTLCPDEHLARWTKAPEPNADAKATHGRHELAAAAFRLRPYQQLAVEAVLEALR